VAQLFYLQINQVLRLPGAFFSHRLTRLVFDVRAVDGLQGVISRSQGMGRDVGCGDSLPGCPGGRTSRDVRTHLSGGRVGR
jgi:hypothetical protein